MSLAPIVLFVYKRPQLTRKVLQALTQNILAKDSILHIYCDGPKANASKEDKKQIAETRAIVQSKKWCKEVHIIEREQNIGLANSIISGVSELTEKYGKVIVLEDDIVTSKHFLQYMNDALDLYEKEEKVLSIGAMNFFANDDEVEDTFFIPIPDCWGWATWKNRWDLFEPDGKLLLKKLREKNAIDAFNLEGAYDYEQMLLYQIQGLVDSWAIRWQAVAYTLDKITLYPKYSVTKNIGFNVGATHTGEDVFNSKIKFCESKIAVKKIDLTVKPVILHKLYECFEAMKFNVKIKSTLTKIKDLTKDLSPPFLIKELKKIKNSSANHHQRKLFSGNFKTWNEALAQSENYGDPLILEKVSNATKLVNEGIFSYERDSVLFKDIQYNWALLSVLQKIAAENGNELYVLDFGGSLGSAYRQNSKWLQHLKTIKWIVVEQANFVEKGKKEFEDENLKFEYTCEEALAKYPINCLLLSSVLQYLEKPTEWINQFKNYQIDSLIIDRVGLINAKENIITVQNVPKGIYDVSYPVWFFEPRFIKKSFDNYKIEVAFQSFCDGDYHHDEGYCSWKGFYLKKDS